MAFIAVLLQRFPVGNPHLALRNKRIVLSDVTFAVFHYPVVLVCSEYRAGAHPLNAPTGTLASISSCMPMSTLSQTSDCLFMQFSPIILIHDVLSLRACKTREVRALRTPCGGVSISPQLDMLHSPSGFPFRISREIIGCGFSPLNTFTYPLLKGGSTQSR